MTNNFYWTVYKNLENELSELSSLVHIDDRQIDIYSIKIAELLLRTSVEIESISKTLYFQNGGTKPDDINLFFDTDCLGLLEDKFLLSKKQVQASSPNFYFVVPENQILTPLKKASKRGSSSSDWKKAYQAIKHNRVTSLQQAKLKYLIRAMAALYVLNVYYNDNQYLLEKDPSGLNFDRNLGSAFFSIKLHINQSVQTGVAYSKNSDFDECVYLLKPTDQTRDALQQTLTEMNNKSTEYAQKKLLEQISQQLNELRMTNTNETVEKIESIMKNAKDTSMMQVLKEDGQGLNTALNNLKYEAILNKQQY